MRWLEDDLPLQVQQHRPDNLAHFVIHEAMGSTAKRADFFDIDLEID